MPWQWRLVLRSLYLLLKFHSNGGLNKEDQKLYVAVIQSLKEHN